MERLGDAGLDRVAREHQRRSGRRRGTAEVEPLRTVAAEVLHDSLLSATLDSFRHELEPERLPQAHDSLEEREIGRAAVDLGRKAAVDLHDVDRKTLEIRQ